MPADTIIHLKKTLSSRHEGSSDKDMAIEIKPLKYYDIQISLRREFLQCLDGHQKCKPVN